MNNSRFHPSAAASFLLCLVIALTIFWPGLSGEFILDDAPVLGAMGDVNGLTNVHSLWSFVLSHNSPLGRPLTMLSFALNDQYWPAVAWGFKYTNLLIHLLNGILVFVLARQLASLASQNEARAQWVALVTMAVWMFHPMQLSTMMLVVQRMTQLMTLFTLSGLICYVHGRQIIDQQLGKGYFWMSLGIGVFGLLAVLSKENGVLICVYALVIEATLVTAAGIPKPRFWRGWSGVFLIAPLVLLVAGVVIAISFLQYGYDTRDFTPMERLMTEGRVLFDYLGAILLPRQSGSGLFHDDYVVSTGFLQPPATLLCLVLIVAGATVALWKRYTYAVPAFAVLWFLGGHLVESTVVGLELYFEHRNYLPMVGPLFAIVYYMLSVTGRLRRVAVAGLFAFLALQLTMSYQSARIWGNDEALAHVWAAENPTSIRAQKHVARYFAKRGNYHQSISHLLMAAKHHPMNIDLYIKVMGLLCIKNSLETDYIDHTIHRLPTSKYTNDIFGSLSALREYAEQKKCEHLDHEVVHRIHAALLQNTNYVVDDSVRSFFLYEKGRLYANQGSFTKAMKALDDSYAATPDASVRLLQAEMLASESRYEDALRYLSKAREFLSHELRPNVGLERDINALEQTISMRRRKTDV